MAENLIPIAVSSELDVTGEERIHVANRAILTRPVYVPAQDYVALGTYISGTQFPSSDWHFLSAYRLGDTPEVLSVDIQPATVGRGTSISPNGRYIACPIDGSPFVSVYERVGDTYTKMTTPVRTTSASIGYSSTFSPDSSTMFIAYRGGGSFAHVIAYELVAGVWTEVAALLSDVITVAVTTPSTPTSMSCADDSGMLAVAFGNSGLRVFTYNGASFTDVTASMSPNDKTGQNVSFARFNGDYLALRTGGFPNLDSFSVYSRSGSVLTQVATVASDTLSDVGAWSPDGTKFIGPYGGSGAGTFVGIYDFDGSSLVLNSTITIPLISFNSQSISGITANSTHIYIATEETVADVYAVRAYQLTDGVAVPALDLPIPDSPTVGMWYAPASRSLTMGRG